MSDEIPYPPRPPASPGRQRVDWEGVRGRVSPSAAQLVDDLQRAIAGDGDPVRALRAALTERLAGLEAEFERLRSADREPA